MPKFTPATKVTRTAAWGAKVVLHGETLAEAAAHAHHLAEQHQLMFVHPYDDPAVIAGQGTVALELLHDAPDLDALVIPVGGGGLLAGCLVTAMAMKPGISVYGVEVEAYAPMAQRLAGRAVSVVVPPSPRASPSATSARSRSASSGAGSPTCWWCLNGPSKKRSAC